MQQSVDDIRVIPVSSGPPCLIMQTDVVDVSIHGRQKGGAETASPRTLLTGILNHLVGMRTCFAIMTRLVVLVEGVGAPEHAIAVGTRVLLIAFVELILVSLPVKLPFELGITTKSMVSKGKLTMLEP